MWDEGGVDGWGRFSELENHLIVLGCNYKILSFKSPTFFSSSRNSGVPVYVGHYLFRRG